MNIDKTKKNITPKVGVGVLIFNHHNEILMGKRKNSHGLSKWGLPGGHLEFGETFEECAIREVKEEVGIEIAPTFLTITNDRFEQGDKHYISIFMTANITMKQKISNLEPYNIEKWCWFDILDLPNSLFLPLENLMLGKNFESQHNPYIKLIHQKIRASASDTL